ncbi:uncharacterized protein LOC108863978, partial [Galendromus occidentalis]|uniref:Uncharacterized protein LOC108863978 n=1 Tax=Galendromus occidentalis TaxID=34638 RepID=A0AAJ7P978_9ACAR
MPPQETTAITLNVDGNDAPKIRFNPALVLRDDGANYLTWKTLVPGLMQAETYAWEVITEKIVPDEDATKNAKYITGNRNARTVFFNIVNPNIILELFYGDSETVSAVVMWTKIKDHFLHSTGVFKQQALDTWLNYEYNESLSAQENIQRYKSITYGLTEVGESLSTSVLATRFCTKKRPQKRAPKGKQEGKPEANVARVFLTENSKETKGSKSDGRVHFIVDSGSSHHVLNDRSFFTDLDPVPSSREVKLGNNSILTAHGSGVALLTVRRRNKSVNIKLRDALYVPDMNTNLISVSKLTECGYKVSMNPERTLISTGQGRAVAECKEGLYILDIDKGEPKCLQTTSYSSKAT